jgi:hypothetical protein
MYESQFRYYEKNKDALRIKARIAYHAKKRKGTFFSVRHYENGVYPFSKDITNGNFR